MDKISVITPTYNDGDTLELHIETFLEQDYPEKELILIDDGSKDTQTKKILDKYEKNELIKVIRFKKNQGACVARNEGAKIATGDVYSFLPADSFTKPGILSKWMKELEDNPDVAFIYGGYTFVDNKINKPTWLGGQIMDNYFSRDFDEKALEWSNYIDGSFPIRKEAFWESAKKMGLEDGLWNPDVKSLQDWDFWLSVVKEGGYKGKFVNYLWFETTIPHVKGLSYDSTRNWLARTKQIRSIHNIPEMDICVTSLASPFHGQNVAKILDAEYRGFPAFKQHDFKMIYVIGFFPMAFQNHVSLFMQPNQLADFQAIDEGKEKIAFVKAKKAIHFIGTDVLQFSRIAPQDIHMIKEFIENNIDAVFCEIPEIQKELKAFGIESEVLPFPPKKFYEQTPLPKKDAVAIYLPVANQEFYFRSFFLGDGKRKGLAHKMKNVDFYIFGNPGDVAPVKAKNIHMLGAVDDMQDVIDKTKAIVRLTPHDGLPISVCEWISAGRNALTTIDIPYADHFDLTSFYKKYGKGFNIGQLEKEVMKSIKAVLKKPANTRGATHYRKWLDPKKYKAKLRKYLEYDEKRYWEKRSNSWDLQTKVDKVKEKELKDILKMIKFKSVLDVGCGNGRFVDYFKGKDYIGCDISEKLVNICKDRYPQGVFFTSSVEDLKLDPKADLIFSYTVLEHVPPENFEKAVKALKGSGKKLLLVEPKNFIPDGDYCFNHDYAKHFKIKQKWGLGDKQAMLIEL